MLYKLVTAKQGMDLDCLADNSSRSVLQELLREDIPKAMSM